MFVMWNWCLKQLLKILCPKYQTVKFYLLKKYYINQLKTYLNLDGNSAHGVLALDYDSQEELYELAHSCLNTILTCFPL